MFISFTGIDKLGINPQSHYNTPLGIYAYPAKYASDTMGLNDNPTALPFAGDQPYANLFNVSGNIIDVSNMSLVQNVVYGRRVSELWAKISGKSWKESVDEVESIINDAEDNAKFRAFPGGQFWYTTMRVSENLLAKKWGVKASVAWNKLFRLLDIDGVIDQGVGIIHTSEPTQAIFFSIKPIQNVQQVYNKYSGNTMQYRKTEGELKKASMKRFLKLPLDQLLRAFDYGEYSRDFIKYVKDPQIRLQLLHNDPSMVSYLKKTTDEEQQLILSLNPMYYQYIRDRRISNFLAIMDNAIQSRRLMPKIIFASMTPTERAMVIRKKPSFVEYDPEISKETVAAALEGYDILPRWMPGLAKRFDLEINKPVRPKGDYGSSIWDEYMKAAEDLEYSFNHIESKILEFKDQLADVPTKFKDAPDAIPIVSRDYIDKIDKMRSRLKEIRSRWRKYVKLLQHK